MMSFKKRGGSALPVSQGESNDEDWGGGGGGLRRRLSSLSLNIHPGAISSSSSSSSTPKWGFQRSKSQAGGSSLRKWWEWGWSWILSRKLPPPFFFPREDHDLEMDQANKDQKNTHLHNNNNKDNWRHLLLKLGSEIRNLTNIITNKDHKVVLPKTCTYNNSSSKNFDDGIIIVPPNHPILT